MAGLASALLVMFIMWGTEVLFHIEKSEAVAYVIDVPDAPSAAKDVEVVKGPSLAELLASATVAKGEKVFKKCTQCHSIAEGGKNGTGPNLWNTVGEDVADAGGFPYSGAMAGVDGNWTFEKLDAFLKKPSGWLRGTKMSFAGLKKDKDRAAVIKYLWVNGDQSDALPQAAASR
ncbi:MAG: cytochrome c family protein [Pseudomonadota bacterium]